MRTIIWLILTKVGIAIAIAPLLYTYFSGVALYGAIFILSWIIGFGLWGFGYGVIFERTTPTDQNR